jgi:ketosteroid isomerase-like protein
VSNADVVRRGYQALNRRDVEGWLATCRADVELREFADSPDASSFHGHEGLRTWVRDVLNVTDEYRFEVEDLVENGDRVLAVVRFVARGRQGLELDVRIYHMLEMRDQELARVSGYRDEADAREAAGL